MRWYFKRTWCGMVLMILREWDDDGMPMSRWDKATEAEAQGIMLDLISTQTK